MALFESYDRRIKQIQPVMDKYGIKDFEDARKICTDKGFDPYEIVKGIQPICFENACWAYTLGAAIAIKSNCTKAADAAKAIGEGLQAFCIPGSVADDRKVGLGHGNLASMLLTEETKCFAFLAGHESFAAAEGAIGIAKSANKVRKGPLINTKTKDVFIPKAKYEELVGNDKTKMVDLLVTKKMMQATSRSFIFSREMLNVFRKNCSNAEYLSLIESLVVFGNRELYIIKTKNSGLISMNALPLPFNYKGENTITYGNLMIPLDSAIPIPEDAYDIVQKVIENMNIVLKQIVPDLTIDVVDLGTVLLKNGNMGRSIQLMSLKNGKAIPFKFESEGIKKIVSILQLLIVVYNNASITVAIDEIDAGIFEYMLGELLNIISEKGKGQLIFTSHNLRPLETIDKGFIAFTTTNPEKRYIRMTNVKGNNNLRDFYYRDIVLGEQNEQLYNPTNNFEIALAFREAGEAFDS